MAKKKVNAVAGFVPGETEAVVPETTPSKKKVEIDADVLERLLARVDEMDERTKQYEQTASQDQIRKIEALRASGKLVKSVKLRRFDNKLVIGWKIIEDKVWVQDGRLNEVQTVKIFFDDLSDVDTTLLNFTRGTLYEPYEVIREARLGNGDTEFTVMLDGGKEVVINSKYVN